MSSTALEKVKLNCCTAKNDETASYWNNIWIGEAIYTIITIINDLVKYKKYIVTYDI